MESPELIGWMVPAHFSRGTTHQQAVQEANDIVGKVYAAFLDFSTGAGVMFGPRYVVTIEPVGETLFRVRAAVRPCPLRDMTRRLLDQGYTQIYPEPA